MSGKDRISKAAEIVARPHSISDGAADRSWLANAESRPAPRALTWDVGETTCCIAASLPKPRWQPKRRYTNPSQGLNTPDFFRAKNFFCVARYVSEQLVKKGAKRVKKTEIVTVKVTNNVADRPREKMPLKKGDRWSNSIGSG